MTVPERPATGIVGPVWTRGYQPAGVAGPPASTLITLAMGPQGQLKRQKIIGICRNNILVYTFVSLPFR